MDFLNNLIQPEWILSHGGIWLLVLIVFAETGLLIGFIFPGDSLLFITGMTLSANDSSGINILILPFLLSFAAILGNIAGYWFGKKSGKMLFKKNDSFLFKKKHLKSAHDFYEKMGGGALIFSRFIPFLRTFAPIAAGIAMMDYRKFIFYSAIGSFLWVFSIIFAGYFLSKIIPGIDENLEIAIIVISILSLTPFFVKYLKSKIIREPI